MSFTLQMGYSDASVNGSVRILGGPQPIVASIINGELRSNANTRGVALDPAPGRVYTLLFDSVTAGGQSVSIPAIPIPVVSEGQILDIGQAMANAHQNFTRKHN